MQLKSLLLKLILLISITTPISASAIQVNSMLSTFNTSENEPVFTVTNNDGIPLFVKTDISEITVENNKIIDTPYTNDNIQSWKLNTTPSKLMLVNGQSKDVYADDLCQSGCNEKEDKVFRISFIPRPYIDPGKKIESSSVSLLVGFAPLLVIPANDPVIDYDYQIDREKSTFKFNNKGSTLLYFSISSCTPAKLRDGELCQSTYPVLAGRNRSFNIPTDILASATKLTVVNHDETFIKTFDL